MKETTIVQMEYRRLGKAGVKVSVLSLGAWVTYGETVGEEVALECMTRAYEGGMNFFDNAEAYGQGQAELVMGRVLAKTGWPRDTFLVSSKVFWGGSRPNQTGLSRKHVVEACHAALKRLQVDYLDFYFCHRPDPDTPVEETVRAMHDLICQGKVLYWGTSEWSAERIEEAWAVAEHHGLHGPAMEQPQYNLFWRDRVEREYARLYERFGLGTTIWSPLLSGLLTGKYLDAVPEGARLSQPNMKWLRDLLDENAVPGRERKLRQLRDFAGEFGCSLAQLAIAWCARNPRVSTVITGASRPEQVTENLAALEVLARLDEPSLARIEAILAS